MPRRYPFRHRHDDQQELDEGTLPPVDAGVVTNPVTGRAQVVGGLRRWGTLNIQRSRRRPREAFADEAELE